MSSIINPLKILCLISDLHKGQFYIHRQRDRPLEEGIRKTYEWIVDQDPNATEHAQLEDSLDYETSIFAG